MSDDRVFDIVPDGVPEMPPWYALDHAAVIYPAIMSERLTVFFRIQARLDRPVDVELLTQATRNVAPRFPYYQVELKRGVFWFYLERNPAPHVPVADSKFPMQKQGAGQQGAHLYRIRAWNDRVAIEVCHILTDGGGGYILFRSILAEYFRLQGEPVPYGEGIFDPNSTPDPAEWEDSFARYSVRGTPWPEPEHRAWHIPGPLLPTGQLRITTGRLSLQPLMAKAKSLGGTVTEYLVAHYMSVLQDIQDADPLEADRFRRRTIKIEVPANMRRLFPSRTMRNFSLFMMPEVDTRLGRWEFDDIVKTVKHQMALDLQKHELLRTITRNVEAARSLWIRALPLPIKNVFMRILFHVFGESLYSGVFSNMGPSQLPDPLASRVKELDMFMMPSHIVKTAAAMVSHGDAVSITFCSHAAPNEVERRFFTRLVKDGLRVKVESNIT